MGKLSLRLLIYGRWLTWRDIRDKMTIRLHVGQSFKIWNINDDENLLFSYQLASIP